jgi:hypothetical protein
MRRSIWLSLSLVLVGCWVTGCEKAPPRMEGQPVDGKQVEGSIKIGKGKEKPVGK